MCPVYGDIYELKSMPPSAATRAQCGWNQPLAERAGADGDDDGDTVISNTTDWA